MSSQSSFSTIASVLASRTRLVFALFAVCATACTQKCSSDHSPPANETPSASANAVATAPPSASVPRPDPVESPKILPQLVACDGLDFYRITENSLQRFEASKKIPPPEIRGSATAGQTARFDIPEPLNVIQWKGEGAVVIAKKKVFRYEKGEKKARAGAAIATSAPITAWIDQSDPDVLWVRTLGEEELDRYQLSSLVTTDDGPVPGSAQAAPRQQTLPNFDGRHFTVLADGAYLYSTPSGLALHGRKLKPASFPALSPSLAQLFADVSKERYWFSDASGRLALQDLSENAGPVLEVRVPGVVMDVAVEGTRVAVLSMELTGHNYRPSVTVFSGGVERAKLNVAPSVTSLGLPELDLCLLAGRPWVVVGGRDWLQMLDFSGPRLLAEW